MNTLMQDFHWDFAVLLTLATLITGAVWLLDKIRLAKRRAAGQKPNWFVDFCISFFPVIAFVLGLRSFIAEPFRIPSGSMIPTLLVGDFILVNKFAYGVRDPVFHQKLFGDDTVARGDIVVFRYPPNAELDYIKRIVGVPGDQIAYRNKQLWINGVASEQIADGVFDSNQGEIFRLNENLTGVEHHIIVNPARPSDDFEITVPEGQYYAMGDNRDGSQDSRWWGTVPAKNLVGKAFFIWFNFSWSGKPFQSLPVVEFSRIGTVLR